jgi:hypothetical protein
MLYSVWVWFESWDFVCVCELWGGSPGDLRMILSVDKFNFCRLWELAI